MHWNIFILFDFREAAGWMFIIITYWLTTHDLDIIIAFANLKRKLNKFPKQTRLVYINGCHWNCANCVPAEPVRSTIASCDGVKRHLCCHHMQYNLLLLRFDRLCPCFILHFNNELDFVFIVFDRLMLMKLLLLFGYAFSKLTVTNHVLIFICVLKSM